MTKPAGSENPSQSEAVHRHFDEHAGHWEAVYSSPDLPSLNIQIRKERVMALVDRIGPPEGARALDLGCGAGLTCVELRRRGYKVVGVDIAAAMLRRARKNWAEAGLEGEGDFRLGNAEALDFEDESFDLVVGMGLIEYLRWDRWALQEIHRVLRPGGHLVVTVPNRYRLSNLARPLRLLRRWLRRRLLRRWRRTGPADPHMDLSASGAFERRQYWPGRLDRMLEGLGYEVRAGETHGFGPFPLIGRSQRLTLRVHALLQLLADLNRIPFLERLGSNYNVLCRKREEPEEIEKRSLFTDPDALARRFERKHRKALARRNAWRAAHPERGASPPRPLEERLAPGGPVLVLSPHPDDEIIGCGGSLVKLTAQGHPLTIVQMTDGSRCAALREESPERRRSLRREEAAAVAMELGAELILWNEEDAALAATDRNAERLGALLSRLRPGAVFVPFLNDPHPDHPAANAILADALERAGPGAGDILVLSYEVWSLVPVNTVSNIDREFDRKERLLLRYRTGMKVRDFAGFCRSLNAWHAHRHEGRRGFTEGFFALPADEYREILLRGP